MIEENRASRYAYLFDLEVREAMLAEDDEWDNWAVEPCVLLFEVCIEEFLGFHCSGNTAVEYRGTVTDYGDGVLVSETEHSLDIDFEWPNVSVDACVISSDARDSFVNLPSLADAGWGLGERGQVVLVCHSGATIFHWRGAAGEYEYDWPTDGAVEPSFCGQC